MGSIELSPSTDLSLIRSNRYSTMTVQYSRGCPFTCELNYFPRMNSERLLAGYRRCLATDLCVRRLLRRSARLSKPLSTALPTALQFWQCAGAVPLCPASGNTREGAAKLLEVPVFRRHASSSFVWRRHDLGGDGISLPDHDRAAFQRRDLIRLRA